MGITVKDKELMKEVKKMKETYDVLKASLAQEEYCREKKMPYFAPSNGICWSCKKNIYEDLIGISVEEASVELITGCPHCYKSFLDQWR